MASGHVVHIERLPDHSVVIYLDGIRVQKLTGWALVEELRPPSTLTITIKTDAIVWAPPPREALVLRPIQDDGQRHFAKVRLGGGRVTPSGRIACETCGEAWPCSPYQRRGEFPPAEVDKVSDAPLGSEHGKQGND